MEQQDKTTLYSFKLLMSTWGIVIDIEGFSEPDVKRDRIGQVKLSEMVWLSIAHPIQRTHTETAFIIKGIEDVIEKIEDCISKPVKIVIQEIGRLPCDYQEEGLYYAIRGWAAEHFNFEEEDINVQFDSKQNVYVFPELC